jgi:predicted TIM-barrel fold metal-dependent hydrolase
MVRRGEEGESGMDHVNANDGDERPLLGRRPFLAGAGAVVLAAASSGAHAQQAHKIPIIDTHIHLFDPNRPQGAPYKGPRGSSSNTLGADPVRYAKLARPEGVVGAICVEASNWVEDNLWVLDLIAQHKIMVGFSGNLKVEAPEFGEYLGRYAKNPLFRGIRYNRLVEQINNPEVVSKLGDLARADRVLEVANPRMEMLDAVIRASDAVPTLRIIVNHLPNFQPAAEIEAAYAQTLKEISARPQIYVKLSEVIRQQVVTAYPAPVSNAPIDFHLAPYRPRLDQIYAAFGEDRVLFGSDWPNSDGVAPVDNVFRVVKEYFASKSRLQAEKYFWRNSIAAYKWIKRTPDQPNI